MTREEFRIRFEIFKRVAMSYIMSNAPERTGDLKVSIHLVENEDGFSIVVDIDYMVYTEERWISPRWKGRENPRLYWLRETVEELARVFAAELGGVSVYVS